MRVLFVNHTAVISGAERSLLDLLAHLPEDVAPAVACPRGELSAEVEAHGVAWRELPPVEASLKLDLRYTPLGAANALEAGRRLQTLRRDYDLIHANSIRAGVVSALASRPIPVVVHLRDCLPPGRVSRWTTRRLARRADTIVANSAYTGDCLRVTADMPELDIDVVHGPVALREFLEADETPASARSALELPPDAPILGIVGQITPWKGQRTAIDLLARLRRRFPDAHLVVVGSPRFTSGGTRYDNRAYAAELGALVEREGLEDHVHFLGERADIPTVMRALDVLLVPSTEEPFGRVVVEGMAAGRTVVATDCGGPAEVLEEGVDGFLAPPNDIERWDTVVSGLLEDPDRRERIGSEARERVPRRFGAPASVDALMAIWQRTQAAARIDRTGAPGRVLFLSHTGAQSGAENAMLRLLDAIPAQRERAVACPPGGRLEASLQLRGFRQHPLPGTDISLRLRPVPTVNGVVQIVRSAVALRRIAARERPDVIHANSIRAGLIAVATRRLGGPPVVVQCHDHLPANWVGNLARRTIAGHADLVVAVTSYTAERFNEGLRYPRAECIHISVDHERFNPAARGRSAIREECGIPPEAALLIEVAQITPWKGQDTALRVLHGVRQHLDAHLLVVGDVAFSSRHYDNFGFHRFLLRLTEELGIAPCVHFLGQRSDVPELMAAADLALLPSWDEPFGTAVAESMAVGTPGLVTSQGGLSDYVIDGVNGRLLPPDAPGIWTDVAVELLTDPETLARMGEESVTTAARFTDQRYAEQMLATYARALSA
jgi:glycosyltransferase involved in cell wall biosynthesis